MNVLNFLQNNVKPATGCTEPIAVAYAVSLAYHSLFGDVPQSFGKDCPDAQYDKITKVSIRTDRDVYKNALAITVPGTGGQKGIGIAAAMGFYCHPSDELNLLANISDDHIGEANRVLQNGKVVIEDVRDTSEKSELDIAVRLEYLIGNVPKESYVRLQYTHNHITEIRADGNLLYKSAIDYEGNLKICCEIYPENEVHRRSGIVGNLNEYPFLGLWFSDGYNQLRRDMISGNLNNEVCRACKSKPKNAEVDKESIILWKEYLGI